MGIRNVSKLLVGLIAVSVLTTGCLGQEEKGTKKKKMSRNLVQGAMGAGSPRTISPSDAVAIIKGVHDRLGINLGCRSDRDYRNKFLEFAVAAVHFGHTEYNPQGGDTNWCIKNAGGGRPQSDDVIVRCDTREYFDIIPSAGIDSYSWTSGSNGTLPGDQVVYKPNQGASPPSSLPAVGGCASSGAPNSGPPRPRYAPVAIPPNVPQSTEAGAGQVSNYIPNPVALPCPRDANNADGLSVCTPWEFDRCDSYGYYRARTCDPAYACRISDSNGPDTVLNPFRPGPSVTIRCEATEDGGGWGPIFTTTP